jgi:hypothetical protein
MSSIPLFGVILTLIVAILFGEQAFFYLRVTKFAEGLKNPRRYRILTNIVFLVFNLPMAFLFTFHSHTATLPSWVLYVTFYPIYVWHFAFFILFFIIIIGKVLKIPFLSIGWILKQFEGTRKFHQQIQDKRSVQNFNKNRRVFIRQGVTILAGATFVGSALGEANRNDYAITDITIPINNLPGQFQGFTISLLSDVHSSVFMSKEQMQEYVRAANALNPDLSIVTGDFVNSMLDEVYPFAEAFSELKAPYGVYGVLGNHDFFTRAVDKVAREVDDCGVKLLRDQRMDITRNGQKIYLLGVDDVGSPRHAAGRFDLTLRGADLSIPKIMLCHRPYFFPQAAERNIDLTLSGHTHGGQIVLARIGNEVLAPARIASHYVAGLYKIDSAQMYVSRGIGTVGIPIRINCPPEITKITLAKA